MKESNMNQDKTKKLTLNRETLRLLSDAEIRRVVGGLKGEWSDLPGCSAGKPCTSECRTYTNC
jgi:hypothetical protein